MARPHQRSNIMIWKKRGGVEKAYTRTSIKNLQLLEHDLTPANGASEIHAARTVWS